jgi:hypothetical protein
VALSSSPGVVSVPGTPSLPAAPPSSLETAQQQQPPPLPPKTEPAHVSVIVLGQDSYQVTYMPIITSHHGLQNPVISAFKLSLSGLCSQLIFFLKDSILWKEYGIS